MEQKQVQPKPMQRSQKSCTKPSYRIKRLTDSMFTPFVQTGEVEPRCHLEPAA